LLRGVLGLILLCLLCVAAPAGAQQAEYRALWVDVFHDGLRTPQEVDTMLATARSANINTLFVQMRKACDAYYNSRVEPKNPAVQDGFDPLAYLLERAHDTAGGKQRLEVHAWLVTYRARMPHDDLWRDPRHVYQRHPEWLSRTVDGGLEDRNSSDNAGRQILDPGVPDVIDYNLDVVRDIIARYPVDGIQFDYFRYPDCEGAGNVWGYNKTAVERFNRLCGRSGKPAPDDPLWTEFRRMQVEQLVRKVSAHVRLWRPQVKVGAALISYGSVAKGFEASDPYRKVMQDWPRMAAEGWLDLMVPMNYKREHIADQARWHREWAAFLGETARATGRFGVNGIDGETLNSLQGILAQAQATRDLPGIAGLAHYCYAETRREARGVPDTPFFNTLKEQLYAGRAAVPEATWLTRPADGIVKGIVTRGRQRDDGARLRIGGRETLTDGTGFYAFARLKPGKHTVELLDAAGKPAVSREVEVAAGQVAECPVAAR
jgi:uncharacterized lipoprotein YddW (UPF0748 family)